VRLFNALYHTYTLQQLHMVDAAYTPTQYQLGTAPAELQSKLRVIFDGIESEHWIRKPVARPANFRGLNIGPDTRVVTYVSRGLESARGFDIFMQVAKRICKEMPNVLFLVAGEERTNYGHELHHIGQQSFKQWVLSKDDYDLSRIQFLGHIPGNDLMTLYNLSDLHIYLTVPYVLSWSMMQAMSAECTVLGSATTPVEEVIRDEHNGLLADFYDVDGLTDRALKVLRDPPQYRPLGQAARRLILEKYDKPKCVQQMVELFRGYERKRSLDAIFETHIQKREAEGRVTIG
jgi:glycosyltransferase involved in cell wall biosynthesis